VPWAHDLRLSNRSCGEIFTPPLTPGLFPRKTIYRCV
jgi:hypothetical protein